MKKIILDGEEIDVPEGEEEDAFYEWAARNEVNEPLSELHHYDNIGAFRAGIERDPESKHFPDTYKLPGHPTFSVESKYYKPGMKSGRWEGETYIPIEEDETYKKIRTHHTQQKQRPR